MDEIQYLLVTGHSGIVPASVVAYAMNKQMIIVRKAKETSHGERVEGPEGWRLFAKPENTIAIDDFANSGHTLDKLIEGVNFRPKYFVFYYDRCGALSPRAQKRLRLRQLDDDFTLYQALLEGETWPPDSFDADGNPLIDEPKTVKRVSKPEAVNVFPT
jgi:hypothetical protein